MPFRADARLRCLAVRQAQTAGVLCVRGGNLLHFRQQHDQARPAHPAEAARKGHRSGRLGSGRPRHRTGAGWRGVASRGGQWAAAFQEASSPGQGTCRRRTGRRIWCSGTEAAGGNVFGAASGAKEGQTAQPTQQGGAPGRHAGGSRRCCAARRSPNRARTSPGQTPGRRKVIWSDWAARTAGPFATGRLAQGRRAIGPGSAGWFWFWFWF